MLERRVYFSRGARAAGVDGGRNRRVLPGSFFGLRCRFPSALVVAFCCFLPARSALVSCLASVADDQCGATWKGTRVRLTVVTSSRCWEGVLSDSLALRGG